MSLARYGHVIHSLKSGMSTSLLDPTDERARQPSVDPAPHAHDERYSVPVGWRRWLLGTNHKDIGTLYILFSLTMLMVGGVLALAIRDLAPVFQDTGYSQYGDCST